MSNPTSSVRPPGPDHVPSSHVISSSSLKDSTTAPYPERFVVQALLLISATLGDWSSGPPTPPRPELPAQLVNLVVTKFLPMRQEDLQKWSDDPEEWMNDEEADRWEFELRVRSPSSKRTAETGFDTSMSPAMCRACVPESTGSVLGCFGSSHGQPSPRSVGCWCVPFSSILTE